MRRNSEVTKPLFTWMVREVSIHSTGYRFPAHRGEVVKRAMILGIQERELGVNLPFHLEIGGRREFSCIRKFGSRVGSRGQRAKTSSTDLKPNLRAKGGGRE